MKSFYCGLHRLLATILISGLTVLNFNAAAQSFKLPKEFGVAQADSAMLDSLLINNTKNYGSIPPGWTEPLNTAKVCGVIIAHEADPNINGIPINQNDVIGAFFENDFGELQCGGLAYWPDTAGIVMSVFGNDPDTPEKDGFGHGEAITYKLFSWEYMGEYDVDEIDLETGSGLMSVNKWYQLGLIRLIEISCFEDLWISASVNQDSLCNEGTVAFTVEIIEGTGNITYNWTSDPPGFTSTLQNPEFFVSGPTTFFVEAFDGVNQALSAGHVNVSYDATIDAGEGISTCGVEMLELNGTTEHTSSSIWATSGDGTFADPNAATTTYFLGTNDLISDSFILTLTGFPIAPCDQPVSDNLVVELFPSPIIIFPESFSTCQTSPVPIDADCYNLSAVEWSTEGNGFFVYGNTCSPIYIPGSYANSHSSVTLTCTGQGIDPCNYSIEESTELIINKNAFCSAGADVTICGDESYELCGAAAFEYTSTWSTAGDGTFTNLNELKPLYTPGPEDIANGGVELTLTVTSTPPCTGSQSDKVELFITPPPTIDAGNDIPAFGNPEVDITASGSDFSSVLWTTTGDGYFEDSNALSTTYFAGAGDLQSGVVELIIQAEPIAPCTQPTTDNVMIIFEGGATADAGPDQTICSDQHVSLQGSATDYVSVSWSTTGDGTFNNPNELITQYFPGTNDITAGELVLTLTPYGEPPNGAGLSDDMLLTIISPASVTTPVNNMDICSGDDVLLSSNAENYGSLIWTTSGDGYFSNPGAQNTQYFPGNDDIATGEVSLTVTVTSSFPCAGNDSEIIEIGFFTTPVANAGNNGEVCEGADFEVNGTASNYSNISWSTSGDGAFDNPALFQTNYTPGTQDIQQGSVFLTLTAQPISPCQVADTDQLYLSIATNPICNAGNNLVICEGDQAGLVGTAQNFDYCQWTTAGDGTFGNPSSLTTDYFPGNSDIQNQSVVLTLMAHPDEPCQVVATDDRTINIQNAPEVNAGPDITICETNLVELSGFGQNFQSIQWNSSGDGVFENPTQLNTTYTPGTLDITGQEVNICLNATGTALCGNTSSCVNITIINTPSVFAGNDGTAPVDIPYVTQGAMVEDYESIMWTTSGNGTFNDPELMVTTYTPNLDDLALGVVTLTLTAESETPCQVYNTDGLDLNINSGCSNATAYAGSDVMMCIDGNPVLLDEATVQNEESLTWTTTGDGYFSDESNLNPLYYPGPDDLENGSVELCLTAFAHGICEEDSDCLTIELLPPPTVNILENEITICDSETIGLSANIDNADSYSWTSNGDGTFNDHLLQNPVYYPGTADIQNGQVQLCISVTGYADCESVSDCIDVTIFESPVANAGDDQTICESIGAAMSGVAQNHTSFYWETSGDGTFLNEGTLFAVYNPGPGDVASGNVEVCLMVNGYNPCEAVSDCMIITVVEDPYAYAGNDKTVCSGSNIQLNGIGENNSQLIWSSGGDGTFNDYNATSTVYMPGPNDEQYGQVEICLTATGLYNCDDYSDCLVLSINPMPEINVSNTQLVCEGEQAQLNATATNYETVIWSTSGDGTFDDQNILNPAYTPGPGDIAAGGTELCLNANGLDGCEDATECIDVSIVQNPVVSVGNDLSVCEGEVAQLSGTASNFTALQWHTEGTGTFSHPNQLNTTYQPCATEIIDGYAHICLTATGAEGCGMDEECLTVTIQKVPRITLAEDFTICEDENVNLQASVIFAEGQLWSSSGNGSFTNPNQLNTTYIPSANDKQNGSIDFCLTGFGLNGCVNTEECITVTIDQMPVAEAGANATICENQAAVLAGIAENHNSTQWQTSGDGNFDNSNLLNTSYIPGTNDIETGEVKLTLEAAGQSSCPAAIDSLFISINKLALAFAGNDFTMVEQGTFQTSAEAFNYDAVTWQTSGTGTFEYPDSVNTTYYPSDSDFQIGSVILEIHSSPLQPCLNEAADAMTLYFEFDCLDAIADAGDDDAICVGSSFQLNGSAINATSILWTTQGDGTFENQNLENSRYYPGTSDIENGQVEICMEAIAGGDCQNGFDCMTLVINKPPIAFAGSDNTIPKYESYYLSEAYTDNYQILQWFTTNGTGNFDNSNIANPTYTPGTIDWIIGNIDISLTASPLSPCTVAENSSFNLAFTDGCFDAVAEAGDDINLCEGETLTEVSLDNAYAANFLTISWSTNGDGYFSNPNILKPVYTLGSQDILNGGVELTLHVDAWNDCNDASDVLTIETIPSPTAGAGSDMTICGDNGIMLFGSAQDYNSVQWATTGDGIFDNPNTLNPMYFPGSGDMANGSVQLCLTAMSVGSCPDDEDCMTLNLIPNATANAGNDDSVCSGNSYQLNGNATGYASILWTSLGDGTFSESTTLDANYFPGTNDLNSGHVTLQLTAFGFGECADIISDMTLEIIEDPVAFAGDDATIDAGQTYTLDDAVATNPGSILWETSGDGTFDNNTQTKPVYYPGINDISIHGATLTITVAPVEPCTVSDSDEMFLTIMAGCEDAIADAGNDITTCDPAETPLNGNAQNQESELWQSTGDGTFDNPSSLTAIYFPGNDDIINGSVELCLTAFAEGDCEDDTDCMTISFFEGPTVNAGDDISTCDNESFVNLNGIAENYTTIAWSTSGTGYFWPQNSLTPKYFFTTLDKQIGVLELILTVSNDNCPQVSDTLMLTISTSPLAYAGDDNTICGNEEFYAMDAFAAEYEGLIWETDGDGTFDDANMLNATYYPGSEDVQQGSVQLCLTAVGMPGCDDDTHCLMLTLNPSAFANAGDDVVICESDPAQLNGTAADYDYIIWNTTGDGTFDDNSSLTANYIPGTSDIAAGQTILQLTAYSSTSCGDAESETTVFIIKNPTAFAGDDQAVCETDEVQLAGNAENYSGVFWATFGDGTFDDESALNTIYTPGPQDFANGSVDLCLTAMSNGTCDDVQDCMTLAIETLPTALAGGDQNICEDEPVTLAGTATEFSAVLWETSGDGTFENETNLNTTYFPGSGDINNGTVEITLNAIAESLCDDVSDKMVVTIERKPVAEAGIDQSVCETEEVQLNGNGDYYSGLLWSSSGDGTFDNETALTTVYTPGAQDLVNGSVELCLTAFTNGLCQDAEDCMEVYFEAAPTALAGDDQVICETETVSLAGVATNYSTTLWETSGDGTFDNETNLNTTYFPGYGDINNGTVEITLNVIAESLCDDVSDKMVVSIDWNPNVNAGLDQSVCETDVVQLNGNGDYYSDLLWSSSGDGTFDNETALTTVYTPGAQDLANGSVEVCLTAFADGLCQDAEDCMSVSIDPTPTADAGQNKTICESQNVSLSGAATNYNDISWTSSGDGYFSNPGILTPTYFPGSADRTTGSVTLTLSVTSSNSCPATDDDMLLTIEQIPEISAGFDQTICSSDDVQVEAGGSNFDEVMWSSNGDGTFGNPESLTTIYTPGDNDLQTGNVTLCIMAFGGDACQDVTDCLNVFIEHKPEVNAGADFTICENDNFQLTPQVTGYSSLLWSTAGDGEFDNASLPNAVYTPGPGDINSGLVELCLHAEPLQICSGSNDCLVLNIARQPFAYAGEDATIQTGSYTTSEAVATNYSELIWSTSGTGTFDDPAALSATYTPGNLDYQNEAVTLTLNAAPNDPCALTASDDLNLSIEPDTCLNAVADAGEDATVCEGSNHQLNGETFFSTEIVWTTQGDGTFDDPSLLDAVYFPGSGDFAAGQVDLCLEAFAVADCDNGSDCMTLVFQAPPVVYAGSDNTIPKYVGYQLNEPYAENYEILQWYSTNGTGDFENSNAINTTYIPGTIDWLLGSIELCVTASPKSPCNVSVTDCFTLTFTDDCNDAVADAGEDISLCEGETLTEVVLDNAFATYFTTLLWSTSGDGTFDHNNILNPVYSYGPQDILNGGAQLTLEAEGWDGSNGASDVMVIATYPAPEANVGDDMTVCGETGILLSGSAEDYGQIEWTTSGDGSFDNPTTFNPSYFPGAEDMNNGLAQICLTATGQGNCEDAVDCLEITLFPDPTANAGDDINICIGNDVQLNGIASGFESILWATMGDGTFDDTSSLTAVYFPGSDDEVSGNVTLQLTAFGMGICSDVSSELAITILENPEAFAGEDAEIDDDESYYLEDAYAFNSPSVLWESSGDGNFSNVAEINSSYFPGANDIDTHSVVTLTINAAPFSPCLVSASDEMFLTINESCEDAFASAGDDITACDATSVALNGEVQFQTGVLWETGGDGTFDDETLPDATYFPGSNDLATGTTELCLTAFADDDCMDDSDCMVISFFDAPSADAGADIFVCDVEAFVTMDGFADNYSSIQWSTSGTGYFVPTTSLTPKYFFTVLDKQIGELEIVLTASNENCGQVTDTMIISINPSPLAYAGEDNTICGNEQYYAMDAFAAAYDGLVWSTSGDGSFDNAELLNATYFPGSNDIQLGSAQLCLTALAMTGCEDDSHCLNLTLNPSAFANAGEDQTICESASAQLAGSAADYDNVIWESTGDGTFDDNTSLSPIYYPGSDDILANQATVLLTAYSSTSCGDAVSETNIFILNNPQVDAGNDQAICETDIVQLEGAADKAASLLWNSEGDGTFDDETSQVTNYTPGPTDILNGSVSICLTAFAESTCQDTQDCIIVTIETAPTAFAGDDVVICEAASVTLEGAASDYSSILWETSGDGTFEDDLALNTIYFPGADDIGGGDVEISLNAVATSLCEDAGDALIIFIDRNPVADAGADQIVCETDNVQLIGSAEFAAGQTWTTDGDGTFDDDSALNAIYTPGDLDKENGSVSLCLTALSQGTCEDTEDCMTLTLEKAPTAFAGDDAVICETETVSLIGAASDYSSILWETSGDGTFDDDLSLNTIYFPGADDIGGGDVEITLKAVATSLCEDAGDVLAITIDRNPVAIAGDDQVICETDNVQLIGSAEFAAGQNWTTDGDGTFDDDSALNAIYTPGDLDKENGSVSLCLTALSQGTCEDTEDCMTLTLEKAPTAFAGDDVVICETETVSLIGAASEYSSILWETSGDGTFEDETVLNTNYYPGEQDINNGEVDIVLNATGISLCENTNSTLLVTIDQRPTVDAGDDVIVCETESVPLNATSQKADQFLWSTSGDGTFEDDSAPVTTYTPGPEDILAGGVDLCLDASGSALCSNATDCLNVTLQSLPNVELPEDFMSCENANIDLNAQADNFESLIWTTDGDGSFETSGELSNTYYPGTQDINNGFVTICLDATGIAGCETAGDCITIDIQKLPVITMGDDLVICENEIANLDATVEHYASLLWTTSGDGTFSDPNALAGTYIPGQNDLNNGNVELCLTATGLNGCADMQECMMIGFEAAPTADAGSDLTVCSGENVAVSGIAGNNQGVLWETSGDGTFDDPSDLNTIYYPGPQDMAALSAELCLVAYGSENCDPVSDCMTITLQPEPVSYAGNDITICEGQTVVLSGSASNYSGLFWTTSGDGNFSNPQLMNPVYLPGIQDLQAETVTLCLKANGMNGCSNVTDCLTVSIFGASMVDAGNDISICETGTATLTGEATFYSALLWTTDGDGTFDNSSDLNTGYNPGPLDIENGNVELCLNADGISPCEGNTDCITLQIFDSPQLISGDDIQVCSNQPVDLNLVAENYQTAFWETYGDGTFEDEFSVSTVYYPGTNDSIEGGTEICLTLTGFGACDESVSCLQIAILDQPSANAGEDGTVLSNENYELSSAVVSNSNNVYWTTNGFGTFSDDSLVNTTYYPDNKDTELEYVLLILNVEQSEPCNLSTADTLNLEVIPMDSCFDVELDAGSDITICEGSTFASSEATSFFESSLLWTTTGDGTFSDPTMLHPEYTPGPADIETGHTTLRLKGFPNAPCIGTTDEMMLTIQPMPKAFAGSDNTIPDDLQEYYIADAYADQTSQVQWTRANGTGDFTDDQVVNATYVPSFIDLMVGSVTLTMTVSPVGPCTASVSDDLVLNFSEGCVNAEADAGEDISLCATDTTFTVEGYVAAFSQYAWTTSGDGTFDHPHMASPKYTLGPNDRVAGELMLYLDVEAFEGCEGASDSAKIEPMPMPVVHAGSDQTICENDLILLDEATVSNYASIEWSTSGDGEFEDRLALVTKYAPGPEDVSEQTVELTLTALSYQPCEVYISNALTLEIDKLPELIWDIEDVNALVGDDVPLILVSKFADSYQWYGPDGLIPGETLPILLLLDVDFEDAGFYYCKLSNDCGVTLSNLARVGVYENQIIEKSAGWSGLSGYIQPYNLDIVDIFADYPELALIKNYDGIYFPAQNINTLQLWDSQSGYEVNFATDVEFELLGVENTNRTTTIQQGWNYLPVLSSCLVNIDTLFEGHLEKINIIKEIAGTGVFWPAIGINTIGDLTPGNAYCLRASEAFSVQYDLCTGMKSSIISSVRRPENQTVWNDLHYTPSTHTIAIDPDWAAQFESGDVLGAFTRSGICAGYMELASAKDALVLFGDDPLTPHADGFVDSEPISLRLFKSTTGKEFEVHAEFDASFPQNSGVFVNHGMSRLIKATPSSINNQFTEQEINIYPNPTYGKVTVTGLEAGSRIEVWNSEGQMLRSTIEVDEGQQGMTDLNLSGCAAGVVYIRIYNQNDVVIRKLVLR